VDAIFVGNHGLEIGGKQFKFVHPEAERLATRMGQVCEAVEDAVAGWRGARVENKRLTATVHVRDCSVRDWLPIEGAIRTVVRPVEDLFCVGTGRAAFDISPRIGWDKGSALKYMERELAMEDAVTVCVGDDETDEAMFRAAPNGITVRVHPNGPTEALYSLPDSSAVTELFEWLADTLDSSPRRSVMRRSRAVLSRGVAVS
jgi:trehalose 6-phosphate phosphatase